MDFMDMTLPALAENLALDEALLLRAEDGGPEVLRLWEWPTYAVVLGAGGKVAEEVHEAACREANIAIARRSSGGGTVLLGPGCLLYSLVLSYDRAAEFAEIRPSYAWISRHMSLALDSLGVTLQGAGISDLALGERKVSGSAQQRKRGHFLHHGTLLYDFALAQVPRFLPLPPRRPDYRRDRAHLDFLTNLPAARDQLRALLCQGWQVRGSPESWPKDSVERLVAEKYGREEWVRRR